ncbi:MAG: ABC transporter permease [Clostridiales bacterium]|nr:ABC transporter permease [Clostridiales bacterium]
MLNIITVSLKGVFRDRILQGIMVLGAMIFFIPTIASLSLRQVTELSITLSLSLISFVLLLLSVFLGATSIWKDIERRYTFGVLSLPISRTSYLFGRFLGISLFLLLSSLILGSITMMAVECSTMIYPPSRPVAWGILMTAILFDSLKYILLVAVAMLFSTFSTSFFLPIFGTISIFLVGATTQQVYDYLHSAAAQQAVPSIVKQSALLLYYLIPNLESFDLKVNAIYALPLDFRGLVVTLLYFIIYTGLLLSCGAIIFNKREMK